MKNVLNSTQLGSCGELLATDRKQKNQRLEKHGQETSRAENGNIFSVVHVVLQTQHCTLYLFDKVKKLTKYITSLVFKLFKFCSSLVQFRHNCSLFSVQRFKYYIVTSVIQKKGNTHRETTFLALPLAIWVPPLVARSWVILKTSPGLSSYSKTDGYITYILRIVSKIQAN